MCCLFTSMDPIVHSLFTLALNDFIHKIVVWEKDEFVISKFIYVFDDCRNGNDGTSYFMHHH